MNSMQKLCTTVALAGLCSAAGAAGSLVLAPVTTSVPEGTVFSVQVRGEAFTDLVVGGGFNFSFNPAVLNLDSVVINTALWEFAPSGGSINNTTGTVTDAFFNTFAAVQPTGNFLVATLNFTAEAAGNSTLALLESASFPFASHLAEVISVTFGTGNVTVTAVPEPATWLSLGLGMSLLPLLRRRRRA